MRVNLVKDNILKALIVFAMPILISNIFQQLYNTMDTMIIGNILGDKSLVAASLVIGLVVTMIIMIFSKIFLYPLLKVLHTPANIIEESYSYISTITIFVGVMFAYNLLAGLLRAIGYSTEEIDQFYGY